ncbi:MAG: RNA polymerase factor sigma-54 [Chromatiales bacterium]|jgi:RNA polymerase sigma-54 factor
MLKPSVQLRLGQSLTMTPQLQQAIRLLQLSTLELQTQIQETLESNPMLEMSEGDAENEQETGETGANGVDESEARSDSESESLSAEETPTSNERDDIPEELPVDTDWNEIYDVPTPYSGGRELDDRDPFENQSGAGETLQEHLLWQINLMSMTETDRAIALALIDAINDDGYLTEDIETIRSGFAEEDEVEQDEVEATLHLIQSLDPPGSGSRNLAECLSIQLNLLPGTTPWLAEAKLLVADFLDALGSRDYKQIMRRMKLDETELQQVISLIQGLNPRPGALISPAPSQYVIPDVFVRKRSGVWHVELNPEVAPRLRVNAMYAGLVRRADNSADNTYMKDQLQEARWFIKSLQSRNETLLKVASAIVEHQRGFLEYGDEAMKPLVLRDIAEQLEMHESTISRVTTQKYMHTPRGVFEFKYFFSSHVSTADGGECSATAIRAMIRKLIAEEDFAKPLSDSKIASTLMERGIHVARRTVAKYREAMAIPPSNERKRLA